MNQELEQTKSDVTEGLNLVRPILSLFPENVKLIQFFAFFNNSLLFIEISQRRIEATVDRISAPDVTIEEIQNAGEDLGTLLGWVLETKILGRRIISILEEFR